MQVLGNLRGGPSLAEEPEYLQLTIAQTFHRRTLRPFRRRAKPASHTVDDSLTNINASIQYPVNRSEHALRGLSLHNVTACARAQGAFRVKGFIMHGKHNQGNKWKLTLQILDQFQSRLILQRNVHKSDIWSRLCDPRHGSSGIFRFTTDD